MTFIDHLLAYAQRELEITNFNQTDFGDTVLKFLEQSAKITNNDVNSMKQLANMLEMLIDQTPISPITEDDFVEESYLNGDSSVKLWRCTRYQYLYKTEDGKYWDDRAVSFRFEDSHNSDRMYLYQAGYNSKREVTLPYFPVCKTEIISRNYVDNMMEPDYEVE